ncbi:hypothetical protein BH10PSE14_BH10PSE14_20810 [soil metagenome]
MTLHRGWYQAAFLRDLSPALNEVRIGDQPLALIVDGENVRAFDAVCPHRGANLCRGGQWLGDAVRCPFHGLRIALGDGAAGDFVATEWPCLAVGGLVFVRHPDSEDHGLTERLSHLDATAWFVPGFTIDMAAPAELVIENAFDALHFDVVHGIGNRPRLVRSDDGSGALVVVGEFVVPASPWQQAVEHIQAFAIPYCASAYSPTVVISDMGGERPYTVLTATVPTGSRQCTIRLSLVLPGPPDGSAPDPAACRYLLEGSRRGLAEDRVIWEAMADDPPFRTVAGDAQVEAFRAFCAAMQF